MIYEVWAAENMDMFSMHFFIIASGFLHHFYVFFITLDSFRPDNFDLSLDNKYNGKPDLYH